MSTPPRWDAACDSNCGGTANGKMSGREKRGMWRKTKMGRKSEVRQERAKNKGPLTLESIKMISPEVPQSLKCKVTRQVFSYDSPESTLILL
jgi:hypothetical protein